MSENKMKEQVEAKLEELNALCYELKLPMFACVAIGEDEYCTRMLSAAIVDKKLKDDKVAKMVCIMRGFDAVPPAEPMEIEL